MNKKVLALAIATTCAASTQVQANVSTRIIGGSTAQAAAYPWMVSLRDSGGQFCGASLVNESWVMTAAHCVEDMTAERVHAVVGDFDLTTVDQGEEKRGVKRILLHPDRNAQNDDHDIAMLELASPVNKTLVEAADATLMDSVVVGTPLTVMGWGTTSEGGSSPDQLNEVQVRLVDQQACQTSLGAVGADITSNMMCAGLAEGGKDSCQGDSGGPLVHQKDGKWHQVGIVSWGEGCALPNSPGVYARVASYNDWVKGIIVGTATGVEPDDTNTGGSGGWDDGDWDDWDEDMDGEQSYQLPYWLDFFTEDNQATDQTLTFVNTSDAPVSVTNLAIDNDVFTVKQNGCNAQLAANESCEIVLTYTPTDADDMQYANLKLTVNDSEEIDIELFGLEEFEGFEDYDKEQEFGLPQWLEFFSVDEQAADRTLRFLNTTETLVTLASVTSDNPSFSIKENGCQATLNVKEFCEIQLTYTPTESSEMDEAKLKLVTDTGVEITVELYGENLAAIPDFGDEDEDWFASGEEWNFSDEDGMCSLDSSQLNDGDTSYLEAEFTGPGVLEFDFEMENDEAENRLTYKVDGEAVRTLTGNKQGGGKHRTELSEGKHKVSWVYKKKAASNGTVSVNNVNFRKAGETASTGNNAESGAGEGGGGSTGLGALFGLFGLSLLRRFNKRS